MMFLRIKSLIEYLKKTPSSFEEQKRDEIWGITFVVISYTFLFFYMLFAIYERWHWKVIRYSPWLFTITLGIAFGFLLTALGFYRQLKILKAATSFQIIKSCKLKLYTYMVIFGVPYNAMAFWLLFNNAISGALLLFAIYFGGALVIYYKDWRPFLRLFESAH